MWCKSGPQYKSDILATVHGLTLENIISQLEEMIHDHRTGYIIKLLKKYLNMLGNYFC